MLTKDFGPAYGVCVPITTHLKLHGELIVEVEGFALTDEHSPDLWRTATQRWSEANKTWVPGIVLPHPMWLNGAVGDFERALAVAMWQAACMVEVQTELRDQYEEWRKEQAYERRFEAQRDR